MKDNQEIRETVSQAYAKAVQSPTQSGCCCSPVQKGVVAKLAGYRREELDALPPEAVVNSFGCGNPLAIAKLNEGDVVLDLGSGAGIDILLAAKKVGPGGRAIGVDMTDAMIAKAEENIRVCGLDNVEIRKGVIEELPAETASVDWVVSNCVINLSPDKPKVFAEIARVLKPGGRMIISDIVAKNLPEEVRRDDALYSGCVAGAISEQACVTGLREAGLEDVEIRERIVYDEAQMAAFIQCELPDSSCAPVAIDGTDVTEATRRIARALVGKVWSAKIFARKPSSC